MQTKEVDFVESTGRSERPAASRRSRRRPVLVVAGGLAAAALLALGLQAGGEGNESPTTPGWSPMVTQPANPALDGAGGVDG